MTSDVLFCVQDPPGDPRRQSAGTFSESAPELARTGVQPCVIFPTIPHHADATTGCATKPRASVAAAEPRRDGCRRTGCPPRPWVLHNAGPSAHNSPQAHSLTTCSIVELPDALAVQSQPRQLPPPAPPLTSPATPPAAKRPAASPNFTQGMDKNATSPPRSAESPTPCCPSFNSPPWHSDALGYRQCRISAQSLADKAVRRTLFAAGGPLDDAFASHVSQGITISPANFASNHAAPQPFERHPIRDYCPPPLAFWVRRAMFRMVDIRYACSRSRPPKGCSRRRSLFAAAAAACSA